MRKDIYLIKGNRGESYEFFSEDLISLTKSLISDHRIERISMTFTHEPPPKISIIPFKKDKIASISMVGDNIELVSRLINHSGFLGAYSVDEALPVAYDKLWSDLELTPGVCLLTLFNQKKGIDYDSFIDRWHNSHTPLSLKFHPLWHYNRNVVTNKLTPNSVHWDGIVEEHMKTRSELLNPFKFFGNPLVIIPRMIKVYSDTKSFLDYKSIEPYFTREIHIKSPTT